MTLELRVLNTGDARIDMSSVRFDRFVGTSLDQIRRTLITRGNQLVELGDCFEVTGSTSQPRCRLMGETQALDGVGSELKHVEIVIEGSLGRHVGQDMRGGEIDVRGSVGDFVGGPSRGKRSGMRGGRIRIRGDAGRFVGYRLRRDSIFVDGHCGGSLAAEMVAGTIVVGCAPPDDFGAGMRRGTIVCFSEDLVDDLLPHVGESQRFSAPMPVPDVMHRILARWVRTVQRDEYRGQPSIERASDWCRLLGDCVVGGMGEVWLRRRIDAGVPVQ
jgi:formylmethanofuran dehydrogenase subunit C